MSTVQDNLLRLAQKVNPVTKSGKRFGSANANGVAIASSTSATPIEITTATAHGRSTGDLVSIIGHTTNTAANNTATNPYWAIIWVSSTKYTLTGSVGNGTGGATGTATGFLIGSIDGSRFSRQRLLDIYNEARSALFEAIKEVYSLKRLTKELSGTIVKKTDLTFASGSASVPTGFIEPISLTDVSGNRITINPVSEIERLRDLESATNRFVFDYGTTFKTISSSTYVADLATYILTYLGLTTYTFVTDVLPGTTVEQFNEQWIPKLLEIAVAIAKGQSNNEALALAKKLVGGS